MDIKISVIIPVYNAEQYLKDCVDSIINQSYQNFELILVNDGSSDNSPKICDDYAAKDNRIIVIHSLITVFLRREKPVLTMLPATILCMLTAMIGLTPTQLPRA